MIHEWKEELKCVCGKTFENQEELNDHISDRIGGWCKMILTKYERFQKVMDKIHYRMLQILPLWMFILMIYIMFSNVLLSDKLIGMLLTGFIMVGSIKLKSYY